MIIGIAGPYTAPTAEQRQRNLDAMNETAARLLERGHIPLIGMNAALPVLEKAGDVNRYASIMDISLAVISACEAILVIDDSPGVQKERDLVASKGLPVYYSLAEIPGGRSSGAAARQPCLNQKFLQSINFAPLLTSDYGSFR